ncbi:MAG: T9SS type A sorting domain-containing protein [Ferruginibacter sp.]
MKRNFTLVIALFCILNNASAQLTQTCFTETFTSQTSGWTYGQGASEGGYSNPVGCTNDRGIITPGVGGNNPANVKTPNFTSTGAVNVQLTFDIFCVNSNLACNSWKDFECPTSIDVFYYVGATKFTGITDLVLPANGPLNSPTVNFSFGVGNNLPAGTVYKIEIAFKPKSGIGNCGQPGTKYILDNFKKCEITCNNCTIDAINDSYCLQSANPDNFTGDLSTNDLLYQGSTVSYSLANGPFANGNSAIGGATLTINANGTFTLERTDLTKSIFDFTYRVSESFLGLSDLASCKVCFPVGGVLPIIMTDFNTKRKDKTAILNWRTSFEYNALKFEIEKMSGTSFITVGMVAATNNGSGYSYSFTENNSSTVATQYRIKMIDKDNQFRYSEIRTVKGLGAAVDFTISPNPSNGSAKITSSDISGSESTIQVFDNIGRVVRSIPSTTAGNSEINGLQKGIYLIRLTKQGTGEQITKKLVVNQ